MNIRLDLSFSCRYDIEVLQSDLKKAGRWEKKWSGGKRGRRTPEDERKEQEQTMREFKDTQRMLKRKGLWKKTNDVTPLDIHVEVPGTEDGNSEVGEMRERRNARQIS